MIEILTTRVTMSNDSKSVTEPVHFGPALGLYVQFPPAPALTRAQIDFMILL